MFSHNFSFVTILMFGLKCMRVNGEQPVAGLDLRQERIDARVCEDSVDGELEWDLCLRSTQSSTINPLKIFSHLPSFGSKSKAVKPKSDHCMCDKECELYNDCCVDLLKSQKRNESKESTFGCINLYSGSQVYHSVYGIDKCDQNSVQRDQSVREKCETDEYELSSSGKEFSYLQSIAVFSESTKLMYKNVFCALCNDASQLIQLNMSVECGGLIGQVMQTNGLKPKHYDPFNRNWLLSVDNKTIECSVVVQQFQSSHFIEDNNLRECKQTISKCPQNWTDSTIGEKCESYASYVYESQSPNSYKNFHCALCNGVNSRYLTCVPTNKTLLRDVSKRRLWFPLLLDFNFAQNKGDLVGGERVQCADKGQIYDPVYEKCTFIYCGSGYQRDDDSGQCIDTKASDYVVQQFNNCSTFVLLTESNGEFVFLDEKSIFVNKTKTIVRENYEIYEENNTLKVKICRNESSKDYMSLTSSPFEVSFGQILLSELSLYTSIICLTLHLLVYSLIPKLRNLPGKNLMSLSGSLLTAHISFILGSHLEADRQVGCVLTAICTHYTYLAAFCWMAVMAFDVCKTFATTTYRSTSSKSNAFLKYSLYAWLSPAFIVLVSAAFDIALTDSSFRPLYGLRFCWISQRPALALFFALPVAIVVVLNCILLSVTARALIRTGNETKMVNKKSDKTRYYLYLKLSFVMGLTWIFGFIASLTDLSFMWYPFIVFNGLQGTVIFLAFTFKRKVWNLLMDQFGLKSLNIRPSMTTTTTDLLRSGQTLSSLQSSSLK